MPTYEYECQKCGHRWEAFQGISDQPLRCCPKCQKRKARRLISAGAGVIFKGSGFYVTDYRSQSYVEAAKKEKDGAAAAGGEPLAKKGDGTSPSAAADD